MSPMDMVQNPNFSSLMRNQDYFNTLAQLVADRQARGEMPNLMPIGGTGISAEEMRNLTPERRQSLEQAAAQGRVNINQMEAIPSQDEINKRMEFIRTLNENPRVQESRTTPPPQMPIQQLPQANVPAVNQPAQPIPQMQQMQNYNQMLQQGMRRNQDMNQAGQNLVAPAGPVRSFSQMAGGTRRARRTPRQPRNNFLAPSNQKLI